MDYKYINQLLERYWRCETTLEEEQILRSFFSQDDIPDQLKKYRSLFIYEQTQPKADCLGVDFDEKIMAAISEPKVVKAQVITFRQRLAPLFKAAAVVAIILTLSNAAQISFRSPDSASVATMPKAVKGASVAMGDSAQTDSMKRGNVESLQSKSATVIK